MKKDNILLVGSSDRAFGLLVLNSIINENTNYSSIISNTADEISNTVKKFCEELYKKNPIEVMISHLFHKDFSSLKKDVEEKVEKEIEENDIRMVFMSISSPYYTFLNDLSSVIKEKFRNMPIIGGGPFFVKDEELFEYLRSSHFDGWCIGHASPIIEFLKRFENGKIFFKNQRFHGRLENIEGLYFKTNRDIVGGGIGSFPYKQMNEVLYTKDEESVCIETFGMSNCNNLCDYCCTIKEKTIPIEWWVKNVKKLHEQENDKKLWILHQEDNPFHSKNLKIVKNFLESLKDYDIKPMLRGCFLDPSDLSFNYKNIVKMLNEYEINEETTFFIGRETCEEEISEKLGRKYIGKIRKQKELDKEKVALDKFLDDFKECKMIISYILTPWETEESTSTLLEEWELLNSSNVEFRINPLTPFFGTRIRRKYRSFVNEKIPLSSYGMITYDANVIKRKLNKKGMMNIGKLYFKSFNF